MLCIFQGNFKISLRKAHKELLSEIKLVFIKIGVVHDEIWGCKVILQRVKIISPNHLSTTVVPLCVTNCFPILCHTKNNFLNRVKLNDWDRRKKTDQKEFGIEKIKSESTKYVIISDHLPIKKLPTRETFLLVCLEKQIVDYCRNSDIFESKYWHADHNEFLWNSQTCTQNIPKNDHHSSRSQFYLKLQIHTDNTLGGHIIFFIKFYLHRDFYC